MALIYEPKGPAREYAPRACNLYKGCGHHCQYCYGPYFAYQCTPIEVAKEKFDEPTVRGKANKTLEERSNIILRTLEREAKRYSEPHRVLMSFTSDCYQPLEKDLELTRRALIIFGDAKVPVTVLTKSNLVLRDMDLFKKYDIEFATTICFIDERLREEYEPGASPISERLRALDEMTNNGINTWVSLEPVLDPDEGLRVIDTLIGRTDKIKVGTVDNRWDPNLYKSIDWAAFLCDSLNKLRGKQSYYIKHGLWKFADEDIREEFCKEIL